MPARFRLFCRMCLCRQLWRETISFLQCRMCWFAAFLEAGLESLHEKPEIFVGRGFSHDIKALFPSGVLTPEGLKIHFSATCLAAGVPDGKLLPRLRRES